LSDAFQASLEYAFAINLHKFIIITIIVLIEHDPVRHRRRLRAGAWWLAALKFDADVTG
jgi:hypothetical protein